MRGRRQCGTAEDNSKEQQRTADKMKTTLSLLILVVLSVLQGQAQGSCSDPFAHHNNNKYVIGGTYVGLRTTQGCKDECSASSSTWPCYGISMKDGNKCYLVLYVHSLSQLHQNTGWEGYQRSSFSCQGPPVTPCQESFIHYHDEYVDGGTLIAGTFTTLACEDECKQSASLCYGIGMKDGNQCYLVLFVHNGNQVNSDNTWERYQRSSFHC